MSDKKKYSNLTLTFRLGDSVVVGDSLITITQLKNKVLRLTFNAPMETKIQRTNRYVKKGVDEAKK